MENANLSSCRRPRGVRITPEFAASCELLQQIGNLRRINRAAEEIALRLIAFDRAHLVELLSGLHAFGSDANAKGAAQSCHGPDNRVRLAVFRRHADKGAVDLDFVERELLQIAERRKARTEVVERNAYAKGADPLLLTQIGVAILQ